MSQNLFFFLKKHASNIISGASSAISSLLNLSSAFTSANSTITDTSGNGYDATLKSGRYYVTDGATEKIVIGNISGFGGATRVLRVEVKVKVASDPTSVWAQSSNSAGYSTSVSGGDVNAWTDVSISFGNLAIASATDVQIGYSANDTAYTAAQWAEITIIGDNGTSTDEVTIAHYYCNVNSDSTANGLNGFPVFDVSGNNFHGYFVGGEGATSEAAPVPQIAGMNFNQSTDSAYAMQLQIKTNNIGTSNNDQFQFVWSNSPTNCVVDWGDGSTDVIVTYNDPAWTHTYPVAGTYNIIITGDVGQMQFLYDQRKIIGAMVGGASRVGASCYRLTEITSFSQTLFPYLVSNSMYSAFQQSQLTAWSIDIPARITNMAYAFFGADLVTWTGKIDPACKCTDYRQTWDSNLLNATSVDFILTQIDACGTSNGNLGISRGSNAAPTNGAVTGYDGITAVSNLTGRGWTVTTN